MRKGFRRSVLFVCPLSSAAWAQSPAKLDLCTKEFTANTGYRFAGS